MVRYLWNKVFMQYKPDMVLNNLRWIRSDPKYGEHGIAKFIMSLRTLEECRVIFSPDGSKIDVDSIKKFNQAEKHEYLA